MPTSPSNINEVRIDRWLWASRFFKTRTLATAAVHGGHVQLNRQPCKASRKIHVGDTIALQRGCDHWVLTVTALADKRGSATQAALLYQEDETARQAKLQKQAERKAQHTATACPRPDKKQRRQITRFIKQRG